MYKVILLGEFVDYTRHMFRMFEIQVKPYIFIWCVGPGIGIPKPTGGNGKSQNMHKGMIRARTSTHRDQFLRHFINFFSSLGDELNERMVRVSAAGASPPRSVI